MINFLNKLLLRFNLKLVSVESTNTKTSFAKQEIEEYYKCSKDPIYFINTYVKCNIFPEPIDLKLLPYQENMVNLFNDNKFSLVNSTRQSGKTLVSSLYLLHQLLFNAEVNIAIMTDNTYISKNLLSLIKDAYENLPKFLKQGVVSFDGSEFSLENNSKIEVVHKFDYGVLGNFTYIFLDEFALLEHFRAKNTIDTVYHFVNSFNDKKFIITSTKRKGSYFNELIEDPREFKILNVNWTDIPSRDEEWKMNMISMIGEQAFEEQFVV